MPSVWNLGNTTVRNPNRIEQGLRIFAESFQGRLRGIDEETAFGSKLVEEGIVTSEGSMPDLLGRKWRNVFNKLGFSSSNGYDNQGSHLSLIDFARNNPNLQLQGLEDELTPVGRHLLAANTTGAIQDVYLRQLIRHEIPNPIEQGFPVGRMKPFIFLLQVLTLLEQHGNAGINKIETALFLQPFQNHVPGLILETVINIIQYRADRAQVEGNVAKKRYDNQISDDIRQQYVAPTMETMLAYADTTFRYSRMTGLVTTRGNSLIINPEKVAIVSEILQSEPLFLFEEDPEEYLLDFYRGSALPTDNTNFALQEVQRLVSQIESYNVPPSVDNIHGVTTNIQDIERVRYTLIEQLGWLNENQFAASQSEENSIIEILGYLDELNSSRRNSPMGIDDRPTYLEWVIWRSFLAIDHITVPIHETRRFPLDDNLRPRHPAPGNGSDMVFEFEDFILLVEVTLTTSSRQLSAEGEPVRRHVADIKENATKDVYCLFIAPRIDNNTAETFRIGVWYRGDEEDFLNIVPLTLSQFINLIRLLQIVKYSPNQLKSLLDKCLTYRNHRAPQWKSLIESSTNIWVDRMRS